MEQTTPAIHEKTDAAIVRTGFFNAGLSLT